MDCMDRSTRYPIESSVVALAVVAVGSMSMIQLNDYFCYC